MLLQAVPSDRSPSEMATCDEVWHVESKITFVEGAEGERTEQVVLCEDVGKDALVLSVKRNVNSIVRGASWDTLQVAATEHARFGQKALKLNHSRKPNTRIDTTNDERVNVVTTCEIPKNTPLSFNYNTTEWLMAEPFVDWATKEQVGGFSVASKEEQQWLLQQEGLVAAHIRDRYYMKSSTGVGDTAGKGANKSGGIPEEVDDGRDDCGKIYWDEMESDLQELLDAKEKGSRE
eukprot:CAMPEP_0175131388 /NCGR_PEP_ID=MMETSP0087-20121206/6515_1 /TAXON_ID=136419 /ORGANISM="Unknown Unknown, Strain D1" /LENGTH=233 /DNA_ID=CAMNT_0016413673 /DNA_START=220 /DNA_END=921 /DNA_ORIENTATION=+